MILKTNLLTAQIPIKYLIIPIFIAKNNQSVKIAFVANTSWNLYNFRLNLIQGFLEKGIEVVCIAPYDTYSEELKKLSLEYIPVKMNSKGNNPFVDLLLVHQLKRIYTHTKPDIILQYTIKPNIYGTLAAKLAGIPALNTVTGLGTVFLHDTWVSYIAQRLYKFSFQFASKVVFQNEDDRALFVKMNLVSPDKTHIVGGSGVNTERFKADHTISFSISSPFQFLMVARLLFDKGIQEFAEASLKLHLQHGAAVECILIGAIDSDKNLGISKEHVEHWAAAHHIVYKSFSTDITNDYKQATYVVLPSYREGLPKSLLEAGACSKPLIATNVAGCKDVVIDQWNGYLCEVKNAEDLFNKMNMAFQLSPEKINEQGINSRSRTEKYFSDKIIFNEYFCLIEQVLQKKLN